jgi:UDP-glucose 4-epimerase
VTIRRVLVLGGTGFIGSSVAASYLARGVETRSLARTLPTGDRAEALAGVELFTGDVTDVDVLRNAMEGATHVVYAVGQLLPKESTLDLVGDVSHALPAIITVLEAIRESPGVSLTFLSSGGTVYGTPLTLPIAENAPCDPITGYGITKLAAEKYIGMYRALYGISARILRVSNVYGPGQPAGRSQGVIASLLSVLASSSRGYLFGDSVRDYLYIDDAVQAIVDLEPATGGPLVVNVGSGVGHSLSQVVSTIECVTGRTLALDLADARPFDVKAIVLDIALISSMIDWRPRSLAEGIEATWLRCQSGAASTDGAT